MLKEISTTFARSMQAPYSNRAQIVHKRCTNYACFVHKLCTLREGSMHTPCTLRANTSTNCAKPVGDTGLKSVSPTVTYTIMSQLVNATVSLLRHSIQLNFLMRNTESLSETPRKSLSESLSETLSKSLSESLIETIQ